LIAGPGEGALICQMELPVATVAKAVEAASGFVCLNLAPAMEAPAAMLARADLIVVNEGEAAFYGPSLHDGAGLVAVTWGARGAGLYRGGAMIAEARPPKVTVVDSTGAGDAFVAALTVALLEGQAPEAALRFACATGAETASRAGAQPSLPTRAQVEARLTA
jgi:ribokinase